MTLDAAVCWGFACHEFEGEIALSEKQFTPPTCHNAQTKIIPQAGKT